MQRIWLFLLLLATLVSSALGATLTVCAGATYTTIQTAIDAASAGDTISICDGTYNENNIQITQDNLTILGVSGNRDNVIVGKDGNAIFSIKAKNITIKNLTINSSTYGVTDSGGAGGSHTFENLKFTTGVIGIYLTKSADAFTFKNLDITSRGNSIYLEKSGKVTVSDSTMKSALGFGIHLAGSAPVDDHTFSNLSISSKASGIYVVGGGKVTVSDASIVSTEGHGIFLSGVNGDHTLSNLSIDSQLAGLYITKGENVTISNSTIKNASQIGIHLTADVNGNHQFSNLSIDSSSTGIYIVKGGNVTISDSTIKSATGLGIHLIASSSTLINRVCITKATIGIYMEVTTNKVTITNSKISGNSGYGVDILSGTKATVTNNCFLTSPFAFRNNATHDFRGNYWNGTPPSGFDPVSTRLPSCPVSSCYAANPSVTDSVNYRMDECSWKGVIGEVQDSSGNNYNATAKGTTLPQLSNQIINNGALFQRIKQKYVELPALQVNKPNFNEGFTVTTWAAFSGDAINGSWERIFDFGNGTDTGTNDIFLGREGTTNTLILGIHESASNADNRVYLRAPNTITDKNWHFWAVSCNGSSCTLYKDGVSIASSTTMNIPSNVVRTKNFIGKSNWSVDAYFQGGIDEFKVFDKRLNATQISTIYTNELAKKNYDGTARTTGNCNLPTCFTDTFDRTALGSKWSIIKAENYTPNITANKLMLTDTNASIATGVSITGDFPSADNLIEIEFEHNAYGGTGADGVAVVLSDANTTAVAGSYGGSLGYANRTGQNGFAGGWLGFGLDEYGNFSACTEGRHGGESASDSQCNDREVDSFAIRGSGSGQTGYNYITGTTSLSPGIDSTAASNYKYKLTIDTRYNQTIVSVGRDASNSGTYTPILINADATQVAAAPARYKLSLTGSTGDSNNYHSIDNLSIKALQCGTLGLEQIINNFFDAWDIGTSYNINNRKIQTKIVNSSFNLNIASLNEANSDYKDFSGTTCVRVVDSTDNPLTNWSKLLFTTSNPTINTVSLQSSSASKDNRIKIKWKKGQDIACDSMVEDNSTKSSDNFAIRPNNFSSTITANQTFIADQPSSIVFQANQFGGTGASNYNESINGSFKVDVNISDITRTCAVNAIQFSPIIGFNDGISASPRYSLPNVGSYTLSMNEIAGAEFAKVDSADTPDAQRYITPYTQTLKVIPSTFLIAGTFRNGSNGFTYLSNFEQFATSPNRDISAHLDLNISARSATNALLSNYTALCYAKDANLTLRTNTIGTTLTNLSKVLWYENNHDRNGSVVLENNASYRIPLSTALFNSTTMGMAETNFRINFDRNITKPVQPFRFTIQDLNTTDTDLASGAMTLNQDSVFYYGRVYSTDYRGTNTAPIPTTIRYEVYCKDCNRADFNIAGTESPTSLYWFQNPLHVIMDGNVSQFTRIGTTTIANPNGSTINANGFDTSHPLTNATAPYVDRILMTPSSWLLFNLFNASATTNDFNVEFIRSGNWSGAGGVDRNDTSHSTGAFTNDTNITRGNRKMNW